MNHHVARELAMIERRGHPNRHVRKRMKMTGRQYRKHLIYGRRMLALAKINAAG